MEMLLYGRDAGREVVPTVQVVGTEYLLAWPGEAPKKLTSATKLLADLTGHPTGRNWTFDRYFRVGRYAPVEDPFEDVFRLFRSPSRSTVQRGVTRNAPADLAVAAGAGIDLVNRSGEVAKLLFAGFGSWIRTSGYDPDDVLQEVYRGLLARNAGKCPWMATKSSFGHYVHMVCHGVVANYHRQQSRRRKVEQTGIMTWQKGEGLVIADVASAELPAAATSEATGAEMLTVTESLARTLGQGPQAELARSVLPLLRDGWSRGDIALQLQVEKAQVEQAVTLLRRQARHWADAE